MKHIIFSIFMLSGMVVGAEIESPPPVNLLLLPESKVYEGQPTTGHHRSKKYCYNVGSVFVVFSENVVGEGYSFHSISPELNCRTASSKVSTSNSMGLRIGLNVAKASSLLGVELNEGKNEIVWLYQRPINNQAFYDQTILEVSVEKGAIIDLSVFNTITN